MYRISPFTPLFFNPSRDTSGWAGRFTQTFSPEDRILIQAITDEPDAVGMFLGAPGVAQPTALRPLSWRLNKSSAVVFSTLSRLSPGTYAVTVGTPSGGYCESLPFLVTDDPALLGGTTLIRYTGTDNRRRADAVFLIDRMRYVFEYRAQGGFKDDGWGFGVDNEQFTTAGMDVLDVHSHETETRVFTLGSGYGVPVWHAALLNRILSCPLTWFDGVRYTRQESSVPELNQTVEGQRSFIFKQTLQRVVWEQPSPPEAWLQLRAVSQPQGTLRSANAKPRLLWQN